MESPLLSQQSDRSIIYVLVASTLLLSTILLLDFWNGPILWYIFAFHLISDQDEINCEQYTRTLGFKYQARTELWDYHLIFEHVYICFKLLK